jgi:hypothetical protein
MLSSEQVHPTATWSCIVLVCASGIVRPRNLGTEGRRSLSAAFRYQLGFALRMETSFGAPTGPTSVDHVLQNCLVLTWSCIATLHIRSTSSAIDGRDGAGRSLSPDLRNRSLSIQARPPHKCSAHMCYQVVPRALEHLGYSYTNQPHGQSARRQRTLRLEPTPPYLRPPKSNPLRYLRPMASHQRDQAFRSALPS